MLKAQGNGIRGKYLTDYENARRVAELFPVLKWKLPPKRRAWEREHYRTSMFTAAASPRSVPAAARQALVAAGNCLLSATKTRQGHSRDIYPTSLLSVFSSASPVTSKLWFR